MLLKKKKIPKYIIGNLEIFYDSDRENSDEKNSDAENSDKEISDEKHLERKNKNIFKVFFVYIKMRNNY